MTVKKPSPANFIIGVFVTLLLFIYNIDDLSSTWWLIIIFVIFNFFSLINYKNRKKAYERYVMSESGMSGESLNDSAELEAPCSVEIFNINAPGSRIVQVIHNGRSAGFLGRGTSIKLVTNYEQNRIQICMYEIYQTIAAANFLAFPGGCVRMELDCKNAQITVFVKDRAGVLVNQYVEKTSAQRQVSQPYAQQRIPQFAERQQVSQSFTKQVTESVKHQMTQSQQQISQPAVNAYVPEPVCRQTLPIAQQTSASATAVAREESGVSHEAFYDVTAEKKTGSSLTERPALSGSAATTSAETIGRLVSD